MTKINSSARRCVFLGNEGNQLKMSFFQSLKVNTFYESTHTYENFLPLPNGIRAIEAKNIDVLKRF